MPRPGLSGPGLSEPWLSGQFSCGGAQIIVACRRLFGPPAGEFAPDLHRPDHVAHAHSKTLLSVVMGPAAAAVKLGEVRKPALGQIVPLTRDDIEAGCALHCRHEWSVASSESSNARSVLDR